MHIPPRRFPETRLRRTRRYAWSRALVRENRLTAADLIWPCFVKDLDGEEPIASLPGVSRYGIEALIPQVQTAIDCGIPAIAVFPATPAERKNEEANEAWNRDNLVCRTLRRLKTEFGDAIGLVADVALDPYSSHGQDGIVRDGYVVNDETLDALCRQAVVQAEAGCTVIAPSDMMDGRIGRIRGALDDAGFDHVMILSYAAKYASAFYGPFRDAVGSATNLAGGDKKTYQQDPAQTDEAMQEVAMDIAEGADMVMVKPGMPYLDVVHRVKATFGIPTLAYQVSGEYAMIAAAAAAGGLDRRSAVMESLLAFRRAGADAILTYFALDAARWIGEEMR